MGGGLLGLLLIGGLQQSRAQTFQTHVVTESAPLVQDVAAADVDGDGDTDLLAASFETNSVFWYERRADGSFTEHLLADGLKGAYTIHTADLDDNGAVDVLVGTLQGSAVWQFLNDGTGRFGDGRRINDESVVPYDVYAASIDGGTVPDVLVAAHDRGAVLRYGNNGDGTYGNRRSLSSSTTGVRDVSAGTLTGDGRVDVVSAAEDNGEVSLHENTGTDFQKRVLRGDADGAAGVHVADVLGTDAPDVLVAAVGTDEVTVHENTGSGTFKERTVSDRAPGAQSVEAAALDNDETGDVLAALRQDDRFALYEQRSGGRFVDRTLGPADGAISVDAADVDGDGTTDLVAASQGDDTIRWFETNLPPEARDTTFTVREDDTLRVPAPGVLGTARDPDGDPLTARLLSAPSTGTLSSFGKNGAFAYRADAFDALADGEQRALHLRYGVQDSSGLADTARAELVVVGVNDRPRARPDVDTTRAGRTVATPILKNDDDIDGRLDPESVAVVSLPDHGSVAAADSGTIAYTPDPGFGGNDRYTYVVRDGAGGADTAAVRVRVRPPAPRALRGEGREGEVHLRWQPPPVEQFRGYRVYRSGPDSTDPRTLVTTITDSAQTEAVVDGLSDRQVYTFAVAATTNDGLEGAADTARAIPRPRQIPLTGTVSFGSVEDTRGYRMIGLPGAAADLSLAATLSGTAGTDWTAFAAPGITDADEMVRYQNDASAFDVRPGRGFWVLSDASWTPDGEVERAPLDARATAAIPLASGWSVITNPFPEPVSWSRVRRATSGFDRALWGFNGTFSTRERLEPYRGYYVFNDPDAPIDSLRVPYPGDRETTSTRSSSRTGVYAGARQDLRLQVRRPAAVDSGSRGGEVHVQVRDAASRARDAFDQFAPPSIGGASGLRLVLRSEAVSEDYPWLRREARPPDEDSTVTFALQLSGPPGASARLVGGEIGAERGALLHDRRTGRIFDLRDETPVLQVPPGPDDRGTRPLELWMGPAESLTERQRAAGPSTYRLSPPAPNPVGAATTLRYTVPGGPAPVEVRLTVYDVLGRTVEKLVDGSRSAGRHLVRWDARDEQGRPVASGVYFCRLVADGRTVDTRKITVLR